MKRRLALTFAGSAAIVLTAGSAAVAANLGILSSAANEPVGRLDANSVSQLSTPAPTLEPVVVIQDEIVPVPVEDTTTTEAPAPVGSSAGGGSGTGSEGVTPSTGRQASPTVPPHVEDDHEDSGHSGSSSSGHASGGSGADD